MQLIVLADVPLVLLVLLGPSKGEFPLSLTRLHPAFALVGPVVLHLFLLGNWLFGQVGLRLFKASNQLSTSIGSVTWGAIFLVFGMDPSLIMGVRYLRPDHPEDYVRLLLMWLLVGELSAFWRHRVQITRCGFGMILSPKPLTDSEAESVSR